MRIKPVAPLRFFSGRPRPCSLSDVNCGDKPYIVTQALNPFAELSR
ncbi:hypothetical protein EV561_11354 [Rhizobium sp. BK376]|nr:hypothetical protein EV561_11354 [Rhizobium sp. BK376]